MSCSGRNFPEFERRSEVLELTGAARPDLASLTMTTLDFPTGTSQNAPEMVIALGEKMVARGIKPEIECFDFGMINAANMLIAKGCWASRRTTSTCCWARATRCRRRLGICPTCWWICRRNRSGRRQESDCSSCP